MVINHIIGTAIMNMKFNNGSMINHNPVSTAAKAAHITVARWL